MINLYSEPLLLDPNRPTEFLLKASELSGISLHEIASIRPTGNRHEWSVLGQAGAVRVVIETTEG